MSIDHLFRCPKCGEMFLTDLLTTCPQPDCGYTINHWEKILVPVFTELPVPEFFKPVIDQDFLKAVNESVPSLESVIDDRKNHDT